MLLKDFVFNESDFLEWVVFVLLCMFGLSYIEVEEIVYCLLLKMGVNVEVL